LPGKRTRVLERVDGIDVVYRAGLLDPKTPRNASAQLETSKPAAKGVLNKP